MINKDLKIIRSLVGNINEEQMRYVEYFISDNIGIFIPSTGPCYYSITPDHTHPAYSFILPHDDNFKIMIESKEISASHGMLYSFSPDIPHHEILTENFTRYAAIFIEKTFFENELKYYGNTNSLVLKCTPCPPPKEINACIKDFMIEYESKIPGYKNLLNAMGLKITHIILRKLLNFKTEEERINYRFDIDKVIEYIHDNYQSDLTVDKMAGVIALSTSHFSRLFKKETGTSPQEYLIKVRLGMAKKFIKTGEKSFTEIALNCGFNSSSHFSSTFAQHFKLTPSEYKKNTNL